MGRNGDNLIAEICCDGLEDVLVAAAVGADRVELNSAIAVGGLTPSIATVQEAKKRTSLAIISMLRPRPAGFHYTKLEWDVMLRDANRLMEAGSDGIAFSCITPDFDPDVSRIDELVRVIHAHGGEAVFTRGFDLLRDPFTAAAQLADMGVDRILTSGQAAYAMNGTKVLKRLQESVGDRIEILAGSRVRTENVEKIFQESGVRQYHSSCKAYRIDVTTQRGAVSYAVYDGAQSLSVQIVSEEEAKRFVHAVHHLN